MLWSAKQYDCIWDTFYGSCDSDTQEKIDQRLAFLLQRGNQSGEPVTKHLDDGIFELRAKNARLLFYFGGSRTVVFVHALTKKRSNVPRADINLAKQRRAEIGAGRTTPNAFTH